MKFSYHWLRDWVDTSLDAESLARLLTRGGLEVDAVTPAAPPLDGVVVGRIVTAKPHPDADKLQVCQVDDGSGQPLQIVCGAPNAREGLVAPLATVGAQLPGGLQIKAAEIRGVASSGMLCSASELQMADDAAGLLELPGDLPPGTTLEAALGLNDHCIEIDLTPNRGDCLSIRGVARDVAGLAPAQYTPLEIEPVAPTHDEEMAIELPSPADCARFAGRVIRNIDNTVRTPLWMTERLRRSGIRPIDPVVDVTQYVMLELGQPMHAFDRDRLSGPIAQRRAREGETLELLDGTDAKLGERFLVITDADRPVATAGLMGGKGTAVSAKSTNVFLEAAWFNPATLIGRARELGVHSDAAHRFERGVDPQGQVLAIERATRLLLDIVGGEPGPVTVVSAEDHLPSPREVALSRAHLDRLLGLSLDDNEVIRSLEGLGMTVSASEDGWRATAPSSRFDIELEVDLIEEVARVYGYDQLPDAPPGGDLPQVDLPEALVGLDRIRQRLLEQGFSEAITWSFVAPEDLAPMGQPDSLPLANPLSRDLSVMRTSLVPGLLGALRHNRNRQIDRVWLFETGHCFPLVDGEVRESMRVAGVATGRRSPEVWCSDDAEVDFFDLKGTVESLLALSGSDQSITVKPAELDYLHPGQSAVLLQGDTTVGWVGALHPQWLKSADLRGPVFGFELEYAPISTAPVPKARELSRFPSLRRDLNMVVSEFVKWCEIQQIVEETVGNLLTKLVVFDEYRGRGVADEHKSLSFGMVLQDNNKTLTDKAVDEVVQQVIARLSEKLNAELRG